MIPRPMKILVLELVCNRKYSVTTNLLQPLFFHVYIQQILKMNMRTPRSLLPDDDSEITPVVNNQEVDFSEYMWMAEEMEEFDQQVGSAVFNASTAFSNYKTCYSH